MGEQAAHQTGEMWKSKCHKVKFGCPSKRVGASECLQLINLQWHGNCRRPWFDVKSRHNGVVASQVSMKLKFRGLHTTGGHRSLRVIREDRGTSLVEMAMLTPILILLALGIIEIGRYAELSIIVANAARAGVQYGAQNLATAADNTGIQNAALNDGQQIPGLSVSPPANAYTGFVLCGCSSAGYTPGASCPPTNCSAPNQQVVYVEVDTKGNFTPLFQYPGLPSNIVVNGKAQMRVAQ